jgi:hypothetical protein
MVAAESQTADIDSSLAVLLSGYDSDVVRSAKAVMRAVESGHPELSRKVNRGWCAVTYRHQRAGYVCGVFLHPDRASLVFEHGRLLTDPEGVLEGNGKQVRFISYPPGRAVDDGMIGAYIDEAISLRA